MALDLKKILSFTKILHAFRRIERVVRVIGEHRWENDVEHSYQLGMLAWYIVDSHRLPLNKDLVLKYALIHDFVEVHAGDTYIYTDNQNEKNTKVQREEEAALRLKGEYAEFHDLHQLIEQYGIKQDNESRFVYALDKIQPMLNIYTDGGRTWKEKGITIQMLVDYKKDKVALSPEIAVCFNDLIALLKKEEGKLF